MSYNVGYSSIPTFTTNSIGYSVNKAGNFDVPSTGTNIINVCNFSLDIGVYILTVNIYSLVSVEEKNFWYGGISNTSNVTLPQTLLSYSPQSKYDINPFYISSVNFTYIISNSSSSTTYVQIRPYAPTLRNHTSDYNCSIIRIA
jgi:hypothetical protein